MEHQPSASLRSDVELILRAATSEYAERTATHVVVFSSAFDKNTGSPQQRFLEAAQDHEQFLERTMREICDRQTEKVNARLEQFRESSAVTAALPDGLPCPMLDPFASEMPEFQDIKQLKKTVVMGTRLIPAALATVGWLATQRNANRAPQPQQAFPWQAPAPRPDVTAELTSAVPGLLGIFGIEAGQQDIRDLQKAAATTQVEGRLRLRRDRYEQALAKWAQQFYESIGQWLSTT